MSLLDLKCALETAKADVEAAKRGVEAIDKEIERRVCDAVEMVRRDKEKFEGTVHVEIDGVDVEANIPKKVKWDAKLLNKAATELEKLGHDPLAYIDYEPSISEARWAKLSDDIKKLCIGARTVSHGKQSIKLNTEN